MGSRLDEAVRRKPDVVTYLVERCLGSPVQQLRRAHEYSLASECLDPSTNGRCVHPLSDVGLVSVWHAHVLRLRDDPLFLSGDSVPLGIERIGEAERLRRVVPTLLVM